MINRLSRVVLSSSLAAGLTVVGAAAAHATDYLVPVGTSNQTQFSAGNGVWLAHKFTVGAGSTVITYATSVVDSDPFTTPTSLLIYDGATAGAANWLPLATFTQTGGEAGLAGLTPAHPWQGVYRVSYAGSATLGPGTYYASVQAPSGNQSLWGGTGSATATWDWGPRTTVGSVANAYPYYFTVTSGSTWIASGNVAAPMITLADSGVALASGPVSSPPPSSSPAETVEPVGPPTVLQQVRAPESGACGGIDDADLHMGTGITGGWSASWAEWANGPVCTRTMTFLNEAWHLQ